ncbi:MAG: YebC/PmpR family DNA-binding transcriptional regulator [Anaerosolibacter sp.]|jgi:YebC/PmpR family DNA-binding regulatory protein|uniref:YebC/PmpR family DNA-binding transcriptional regulator n=1 Tax=Anaerosolibacter sp. TaxID=1872527 RepID=UPI002612D822|nr:YebC/PmpR family DNA-binding transcriptional regulator [Anaerosolibacter sp.]MDF2546947.1 YebC/PmpR family DNA-binding transcriptional regulator [Anaerosolibacter sp.]
MGRHGTIANRKEKQDAKRAQIFTKYARVITVAARQGGSDPEYNATLKTAIDKAKGINMPNDNIERAIKKGEGGLDGANFESIVYEGYGPNGIAVIVEALTDNRNRTGANMRYYFDKNGGNLGTTGCVGFMFDRKGQIIIEADGKISEDELMEQALEAGAEDFVSEGGGYIIITTPEDLYTVKDALAEKGYTFVSADVAMIPQTTVKLTDSEHIKFMNRLVDMLEDDDDIQEVFHNWEMEE